MQPKHHIMKLFEKFHTPKATNISCSLSRPLCTIVDSSLTPDSVNPPESPDLPAWLRHNKITDPNDDDFVIPPLATWVENKNLEKQTTVSSCLPFKASQSDIDKLGGILNQHYPSTDGVVQALNECGVNVTSTLVSKFLKRYSNNWIVAFGLFSWVKNQTGYMHAPELYDSMIDVLGKCKTFSLMWELVEEMNGLKNYISLATMTKVMRRLARAGCFGDAIEAFRRMERYGVSKDIEALNVLMDALVKEGSVEHAYDVFLEFKDCVPPNSNSFNILIHGYCKARMLVDARKTMEEKEKYGFRPDVVSYTCLVEAYCKEKDFRKVDAILDEMKRKGCEPNVITHTIVMHALGKAGQIVEALEVYQKMKRYGCAPDASFYSSLIFILSKSGRCKDSWDIFEDMKAQGIARDLLTYNTMISAACVHSEEETALKLLQRMEEDSCKANIETYAPLLKMCCRKKRLKVLKLLLGRMFKDDVSIDLGTYELLVRGLSKNGRIDHACFFFEETVLEGMVPRDSMYKLLAGQLERMNMVQAREKIEKLMLHAKERKVI